MKNIISAIACLLLCSSVMADEKKVEMPKNPPALQVIPKGYHVRPATGRYYWNHPTYGLGYWYYPAPVAPPPVNYYIDEYGRVVPSGYAYDINGNLVPLPVATPYYPRYYGRWGWWRR